ncbi:MAG: IclR family transcriptional regulator [Pseudomonadota bacterium]
MPTNIRLLRILEVIANASDPLLPAEINAHLDLPRPTMHRLCQTLLDEGFVVRDPATRRLRPARRTRMMAAGILNAAHIHIARHQVMREVGKTLGETINFVVPEAQGMRYLDRVETDWPLRVQLPIGSHVPFHCTASGKCFLASMPPRASRRFVAALSLDPRTERTTTSAEDLCSELLMIRGRGFATDHEEFIDDMNAVAVPVRSPKGDFIAALAVHGPGSRLKEEQFEEIATVLTEGAATIAKEVV